MKKVSKMLIVFLATIAIFVNSMVFASEQRLLTKTYVFKNNSSRAMTGAFAEVYIGQKDLVRYQKDGNIIISPAPDEVKEDEFGNLYGVYDFSSYNSGRSVEVTIKRYSEVGKYSGDSVAVRSESTVDVDNVAFTKPQFRVESDDSSIIAKAKEITYGYSSDYKRARAIFEYVYDTLSYDKADSVANKGALAALESKRGVCEEFATLYAALCRAVEIPCKVIEGYRLTKEIDEPAETIVDQNTGDVKIKEATYKYTITPHVWNEIYFDDYGWVPLDTCVVHVTPSGTKVSSFDSFCKITPEDYVAVGMYSKRSSQMTVYAEKISVESSSETFEIVDTDDTVKEHEFIDLDGYSWARDSINTLYKMGVIKGYNEYEFKPAGNISRIEFISMYSRLLRNLKYTPSSNGKVYYFLDYNLSHYSKSDYDFIMRLLEDREPYDKLACGYAAMSSLFGSALNMNKPITRGEVVALMAYFLKTGSIKDVSFTDVYGSRFASQIAVVASNGLINGYEDGTFKPNNPIKRAEIATMLDKYVGEKDLVL